MKPITKLHNKYKNKPIWIAGSDPTLSDFPNNFFNNKLSITLHLAYLKFPKATFRYFNERDRFVFLKEKHPEIIKQVNIFGYPFYNRTKEVADEAIGKASKKAYYLDLKPYPPNGHSADIFNEKGPNAMRLMVSDAVKGERMNYGGHGTCLHPCMYVAIMMGCNPINIIGCNFKNVDGKEHFGEAHNIDHEMRPTTPSFTGYRGNRMTRGLKAIIAGCKDNNIKVNWVEKYDKPLVYINTNSEQTRVSKKVSEFAKL
jgi:hypothetical protein